MAYKHILFDLDGTLLPMKQKDFLDMYMPLLANAYINNGVEKEQSTIIKDVWQGVYAMVMNDGKKSNREVFWETMEDKFPFDVKKAEEIAVEFYDTDFNNAKAASRPTPLANEVVKAVKSKGKQIYLATNPLFPRNATANRIKWAGLDATDFKEITTYEKCRYCKPNIEYYRDIIINNHIDPSECIMIGNDVAEDLIIRQLGVKTFLLEETVENKNNLPIKTDYSGSMEELLDFVQNI